MRLGPIITVAAVLILILSIPVPPDQGRFTLDLLDAGHAPLFGAAALILLRFAPRKQKATTREYILVLLITALLGILTELVQRAEGGYAEVNDAVADVFGVASFLAIHWTFKHKSSAAFRWLMRVTALAALLTIFMPPILSGLQTLHRNTIFPTILKFDSISNSRWCRSDGATFQISSAPLGARKPRSYHMGLITFEPKEVSAFLIDEVYPNWSKYHQFAFTVYSELPTEAQLILRIQDRQNRAKPSKTYDTRLIISPGISIVRIPLVPIQQALTLDMTAIRRVILFAVREQNSFSLYVDDFHVE